MLVIDGSEGEGGGQILRTALALSLVTRTPFRLEKVRAKRERPGLMRQHLTAVRAAAEVGHATVAGDAIRSSEIEFRPNETVAGEYCFSVGTAGSATLVLQTVLPALLKAGAPSRLVLEGGTHNPLAPTFDFLSLAFLPLIERMGANVSAKLLRHGFYPAGGGRFSVEVTPAQLGRLDLLERGQVRSQRAVAMLAAIPFDVARRELAAVQAELGWEPTWCKPLMVDDTAGPGNVLQLIVESEHVTEVFTGFGEKSVRAQQVAQQACAEVKEYLAAGAPVGKHLADQLLLPMALGRGGVFRTLAPTLHARTQAELIQRFLDVKVSYEDEGNGVWRFTVAA